MSEARVVQALRGRLGILVPRMGGVETTSIAGAELINKDLGGPIGSLTHLGLDYYE